MDKLKVFNYMRPPFCEGGFVVYVKFIFNEQAADTTNPSEPIFYIFFYNFTPSLSVASLLG